MRPAPSARIRLTALLLVLLAHVPLVLLFLWGWRVSNDTPEPQPVFLSLWPQMPPEGKLAPQPPPQQLPRRPAQPGAAPPARTAPLAVPAESASTAIAAPTASATPAESTRPSIDWRAEAAAAAGRAAAPAPPAEFAPPPKTIHKPCEKKKSSWEWNPQPKKAGITPLPYGVPLPYVVLGRCVVGLGFFGCALQKPPEANSHLLDDMRDGKTSPSSVPDPDSCD